MSHSHIWKKIKIYITIIIGTGLLAFAVQCVYDSCGMVVGGFSGAAILVKEITGRWIPGGVPLGLTTFLLNVPVFAAAYPLKGRAFVGRTFLATCLLSVWLFILPKNYTAEKDFVLAAIFGGLAGGAGIGLVLTTGTTTGGTDMLGSLLQRWFPGYSVAQLMAIMDGLIILAGGFLFGFPSALYAVVSIYVTAKISDAIALGTRYARCAYIITKEAQKVSEVIFEKLERGVTGIHARGMYTGTERQILFCVVGKKEIAGLKSIVHKYDPDAFVIVTEAKEVLGEGF